MRTSFWIRSVKDSLSTGAVLLLCTVLCRAQSQELVLTEEDNGKTVAAVVQQSVLVNLRGNATTGYLWLLTSVTGDSVLTNGPSAYSPDAGGAVGAGGTFSFPFLATKSGETILWFDYERPWDPGSIAQTFTVTIAVTETPAPPRLLVMVRASTVMISWPIAGSTGFYLEGTRDLSSGWAALNLLPFPDGQNYTVTLPASGQLLFFRLRH